MRIVIILYFSFTSIICSSQTGFFTKSNITSNPDYFIHKNSLYNKSGAQIGVLKNNAIYDLSGNQIMWYKEGTIYDIDGYLLLEQKPIFLANFPTFQIPKIITPKHIAHEPVFKQFSKFQSQLQENSNNGSQNQIINNSIKPINYDLNYELINNLYDIKQRKIHLENERNEYKRNQIQKQLDRFIVAELAKLVDFQVAESAHDIYLNKLVSYINQSSDLDLVQLELYTQELIGEIYKWDYAIKEIKSKISRDISELITKYNDLNIKRFELQQESLNNAIYIYLGLNSNNIPIRKIKPIEFLNINANFPLEILKTQGENFINPSTSYVDIIRKALELQQGMHRYIFESKRRSNDGIVKTYYDTLLTFNNTIIIKDSIFGRKYNYYDNFISLNSLDSLLIILKEVNPFFQNVFKYLIREEIQKSLPLEKQEMIYNTSTSGNKLDGFTRNYSSIRDFKAWQNEALKYVTKILFNNEFSYQANILYKNEYLNIIFRDAEEIQILTGSDPISVYTVCKSYKGMPFKKYNEFEEYFNLRKDYVELNEWKIPSFKNKKLVKSEIIQFSYAEIASRL